MITPKDYVGSIMELSQGRRGEFVDMQYMTEERTTLVYDLPLAEVGAGALSARGCLGGQAGGSGMHAWPQPRAAPDDVVVQSGNLQQPGGVYHPGL